MTYHYCIFYTYSINGVLKFDHEAISDNKPINTYSAIVETEEAIRKKYGNPSIRITNLIKLKSITSSAKK